MEQMYFLSREDITPEEFTRIIHHMLKRLMFLSVFFLFMVCPMAAQERTDTVYTFRFVSGNDMFFVPYNGNDMELARLETFIRKYRQAIRNQDGLLRVDGHADDLSTARIRSNRVKSELIIRQGLEERCFSTTNHVDTCDYVTVRLFVKEARPVPDQPDDTYINKVEETPVEEPQAKETQVQPVQAEQPQADETSQTIPVEDESTADAYRFALRTNLLRWATLTPDLGLEWRINPSWGILVNGSWTSWSWNNKDRRYALWEVMPEVRYYVGKEKRGYLGAMYKAGGFNYKLSATGKQGNLMGGGITGGYQLRLNSALLLDFSLAVGCLHVDYEKYEVINGVRVRKGKESKNWWGPINAGVTLVWKM